MDHHAVELDAAWIFRFPKRAESERALLRELRLLPVVAPLLRIAVPVYQFFGAPTSDFPYAFAGYRKLAGTPAIECPRDLVATKELAPCLGRVLSTLHAFPPDLAARLGVPGLDEFDDFASLRISTLEELRRIRDAMPDVIFERCRAFVDREGQSLPFYLGPLRLLHGDLSGEHTLLDEVTGRVVGLIDWADAFMGDPAYDLNYLWAWMGESLVDRVLASYTGPVDPGFRDRIRYYGTCTAVAEVAYGMDADRERNRRLGLAALERAFAGAE
jgi:aminoglycoside phosphotransferase (APT) family kinase protein